MSSSGGEVTVVGGGLAGVEAAWQLVAAGIPVALVEMRPAVGTPAHRGDRLAELVCSNSLRADSPTNAVGQLKREMASLGSLVIEVARRTAVPAGGALAVDRDRFAAQITAAIEAHPGIRCARREQERLPDGPAVIATGPLTSPSLHSALEETLGEAGLSFFDAVAPIVAADGLDLSRLFRASRYGKGSADYLNAPMDRAAYESFVAALLTAELVAGHDFERADARYFEGCLPIEVMAERGLDTLRWGPLKPVGLEDPASGQRPWAVVQLRQDDLAADHWNLVGFQTKLTRPEQRRIVHMIPGLERARIVRYGMIHRNTFINAPRHLDPRLRLRERPELRVAGQLSGVEGYVESAATGLLAGRLLALELSGCPTQPPPPDTALGGLVRHLTERRAEDFQPSNITWGLIICPEHLRRVRPKAAHRLARAEHAQERIRAWMAGAGSPGQALG